MLEGLDTSWVDLGDQRIMNYACLAPGGYTFSVKGSNADGVWSEPATLRFTIRPPWGWSGWSKTLYTLLALNGREALALLHISSSTEVGERLSDGTDLPSDSSLSGLEPSDAFDLVLLDLMMPRMSGYEVCQKIRERFLPSELPVIMVTAKNTRAESSVPLPEKTNLPMDHELTERKINSFWDWFVEAENDIRDFFEEEERVDKEALINAIDERILDFGLFRWEIGPGRQRPYYLLISPNGSAERLRLSKRIIQAAPRLPAWEFYPARPGKSDALQFSLYDNLMIERAVDAAGWRYITLATTGEKVDILLEAPNIAGLDAETQWLAGELLVTNLLGEERKIARVRSVQVVTDLDDEQRERSAPVREMEV